MIKIKLSVLIFSRLIKFKICLNVLFTRFILFSYNWITVPKKYKPYFIIKNCVDNILSIIFSIIKNIMLAH